MEQNLQPQNNRKLETWDEWLDAILRVPGPLKNMREEYIRITKEFFRTLNREKELAVVCQRES